MVNGTSTVQEGGKESSENHKSVAPTEPGPKGSILVISQDEKHWQHWRKTHCTLHPFPISSAQSQSGRGPMVGLSLPSESQTWGSSKPVPLQGPPLTALCSASSNIPTFPSLCSNCPNLGILSFLEVQKREIFLPSLPSLYNPTTLPPGSGVNSGEKQNLDWAVVFIRRISSGLRVWRETSTHKSRIKESRSTGIATQRGGQKGTVLVEFSWDCSSLPQRLARKECPSAILPNDYLQISLEQGIVMYSSKWSVLISSVLSWIKILSF